MSRRVETVSQGGPTGRKNEREREKARARKANKANKHEKMVQRNGKLKRKDTKRKDKASYITKTGLDCMSS